MTEGAVACHHCHEVIRPEEVQPTSQQIEYFGAGAAPQREAGAFTSRAAMVAVEFVAGAVALGIAAGVMHPGPVLRRLAACGVLIGGVVGAVFGLIAVMRPKLGHVDRSLAITSVAMGILCIAAGVVIWIGGPGW